MKRSGHSGVLELGAQFCHRYGIAYKLTAPAELIDTEFETEKSTKLATNIQ